MSYCINPTCLKSQRQNLDTEEFCQGCGIKLLIHDRYRLIRPLRPIEDIFPTEIFEVEDTREGEVKVLKILKPDEQFFQLLKWFEQEKDILTSLQHPGIPKAEKDAYFKVYLSNSQKLHCLVMEKIEGQNLEEWIQQKGAISEETAIDWLKQITKKGRGQEAAMLLCFLSPVL